MSYPLLTGGGGESGMDEEAAASWIKRLKANVDTLCFEAVGVASDHLVGVEWLNKVGRAVRDGCVSVGIQSVDEVKTVRGIMENPRCLWLQIDVSGGGWAPYDAPVIVNDGYVAAGSGEALVAAASGDVGELPASPLALTIRNVADGLGLPWNDASGDSESNVEMESSPLRARAGRQLVMSGCRGGGLEVREWVPQWYSSLRSPVCPWRWSGLSARGLSRTAWTAMIWTSMETPGQVTVPG